ncbi:hypothetical protein [Teichococcus aestuarii]|uniref:hypothetical protein n=1 Tax=Teichococcus aestuarii TaxID=568898 RepID=UPI003607EA7E
MAGTSSLILAGLAGGGALLLVVIATLLLHAEARERGYARRIRQVTRPATPDGRRAASALHPLGKALQRLGELLRQTALFSAKDIAELERAVGAAGFNPHRAVSTFLGVKLVAVLALPALGWFIGRIAGGRCNGCCRPRAWCWVSCCRAGWWPCCAAPMSRPWSGACRMRWTCWWSAPNPALAWTVRWSVWRGSSNSPTPPSPWSWLC